MKRQKIMPNIVRVMPEQVSLTVSRVLLIAMASLVAFTSAAAAQTTDAASGARAHYQKAVAAIATDDWSTAKNELTQAKRLAPRNALVSYDLALAYQHTGQTKSALAELNRALQLGLPPEQEKAAESLKQQLGSKTLEGADSISGRSGKPYATVAVNYDQFTDKSQATLDFSFPQEALTLRFVTRCEGNDFGKKYHNLFFLLKKGAGEWQLPESEAIFLADGTPIALPSQVLKNKSAIPVYLLRDMIVQNSLAARIDGKELHFTGEQISSIREFVDRAQLKAAGPLWNMSTSSASFHDYVNRDLPLNEVLNGEKYHRECGIYFGVLSLSSTLIMSDGYYWNDNNEHTSTQDIPRPFTQELILDANTNAFVCNSQTKCFVVFQEFTDSRLEKHKSVLFESSAVLPTFLSESLYISPDKGISMMNSLVYEWYLDEFRHETYK